MKPLLLFLMLTAAIDCAAAAFDQQHEAWDRLLKQHVVWTNGGTASQVDYAGFKQDKAALQRYLDALSSVSEAEFAGWSRDQRLAFLINASNAFTVDLILSKYPNLDSIKDLGGLFQSPWKKRFFTLLGKQRHLDEIEHGMIREPGVYDEPRIHFAVNCASIGCPALRPEAYVADRLDRQLEDNMQRFLADASRNRYNPNTGKLEASKIFDWYGEDFQGRGGFGSVLDVFANYAELLADTPEAQRRIRIKAAALDYLDYDWGLNGR